MFRSTKISNLKLKGIPRNNNEDRGPITSSTVFHSLKFKGMQDVHLCLYICMYHTVIRSTISGYPPPVHKAQLKFIGRSSFCFSVKGIRFEPPEYGYQLRHPEIILVECKPEEM